MRQEKILARRNSFPALKKSRKERDKKKGTVRKKNQGPQKGGGRAATAATKSRPKN